MDQLGPIFQSRDQPHEKKNTRAFLKMTGHLATFLRELRHFHEIILSSAGMERSTVLLS